MSISVKITCSKFSQQFVHFRLQIVRILTGNTVIGIICFSGNRYFIQKPFFINHFELDFEVFIHKEREFFWIIFMSGHWTFIRKIFTGCLKPFFLMFQYKAPCMYKHFHWWFTNSSLALIYKILKFMFEYGNLNWKLQKYNSHYLSSSKKCGTASTRNPATPKSNQNRSVFLNSFRTFSFLKFKSGCSS